MTSEEHIQELFAQALERKTPAERDLFLDATCRDEPELRRQVASLLLAHEQAGDFLKQTIQLPPPEVAQELPGSMIGRYKLLEKIGEGGFGTVWMAEQQEPVRRRVALKIIKLGMDTKEVVARFEAERQALALMEHPNIAHVFDGGATATGRPYFVMELVKGVPITEYCDANRLPMRERLALFMQVCHAVQHAHQKGVIHRDLKPSNILVTERDGRPLPKVIDFGVAKATAGRLTEKTLFTRFHQWMGTPAYMSPEQAGLGSLDVDTRSDIYSLGVLLYELLTGRTPFDSRKLLEAGYDAVLKTIREQDPPKPSTRLSTLQAEELNGVATRRQAEPGKLHRLVQGDLDWIVMKCLEKDRVRRYETANSLASDVERHLENEPIVARPPSKLYRFQKLVRRNRLALAAAIVSVAALVVGFGISTWLLVKEREAHEHAVAAEKEQFRLRQQAEVGEKTASALLLFQRGQFQEAENVIYEVPPSLLRTSLQSTSGLDAWELLTRLGDRHAGLGEWRAAVSNLELVVEAAPADLLDVDGGRFHEAFASLLVQTGDLERYRQHCQFSLARTSGTKDPLAAERVAKACLILPSSGVDLAAVAALEEIALTRGRNHPFYSFFQATKGWLEYRQGHFAGALDWVQRSLASGSSLHEPGRVTAYAISAMAHYQLNDTNEAKAAFATGTRVARTMPAPDKGGRDNYYCDWIIAHALLRETKALIEGPAHAPPNQPRSGVSSEQQERLELMRAKGPEASLTILPIRLSGAPLPRLSEVVGFLLESQGLKRIELGETTFDSGTHTPMEQVAASLGEFVRQHPITTEYALYAEYNGTSDTGFVELRSVVADKSGATVWTDRQTPQEDALGTLEGPDLIEFSRLLVERLSPELGLSEETSAAAKPGKMARLIEERYGMPPASEQAALPARQDQMKKVGPSATLLVFPVRINEAADAVSATNLVRLINEAGLCKAAAAKQNLLLKASRDDANEMKAMWNLAREFRDYVRENPLDADYALYADCVFNPRWWEIGYVHFVVCNRQGEWVIVDMQNSHHADYQGLKPTSKDGYSRLMVRRLESYLH